MSSQSRLLTHSTRPAAAAATQLLANAAANDDDDNLKGNNTFGTVEKEEDLFNDNQKEQREVS